MKANPISVLGAGSWGTALAMVLARNHHPTLLWTWQQDHAKAMKNTRCNTTYLPGICFSENLSITSDLKLAVHEQTDIIIAVPSHAFRDFIRQIKPYIHKKTRIAWATKGLDPDNGDFLSDVLDQELGFTITKAIISGPSFAIEVANNLPTSVIIASLDHAFSTHLTELFHSPTFRIYTGTDLTGIQICGAVKNVLAIATGIAKGLNFGANAEAALVTRGIAEMLRLGLAFGAKKETFMGLAGLGDLVVTCTNQQSRNYRFGLLVGKGHSFEAAKKEIGQVVEGYNNTKEVHLLARRKNVNMPLCEQVYQVLYSNIAPEQAVRNLLTRPSRDEFSN